MQTKKINNLALQIAEKSGKIRNLYATKNHLKKMMEMVRGLEDITSSREAGSSVSVRDTRDFPGAEQRVDTRKRIEIIQTAEDEQPAPVREGDAIVILFNDIHSFVADGAEELELMILGIAREKGKLDTVETE